MKKQLFDYSRASNEVVTYFLPLQSDPEKQDRKVSREMNEAVLCVLHKVVNGTIEQVKKSSIVVNITDHDIAILNSYIRDGYADYSYKSKETRQIEVSAKLVEAVNAQWKPLTPAERAKALYPVHVDENNAQLGEAYMNGCDDTLNRVYEKSCQMMARVLRRVMNPSAIERYLEMLKNEIIGE